MWFASDGDRPGVDAIRSTYGPHAVNELTRRSGTGTGTGTIVYLRLGSTASTAPNRGLCTWATCLKLSDLPRFESSGEALSPREAPSA